MQLSEIFLAFFEKHDVNKNQKFLLACSGGVDSMALFHLLQGHNFNFEVAHCNFKLRGDDSDADEEFVKAQCALYQIELHSKTFNTSGFSEEKSISIQMAARQLRYTFFDTLLEQKEFDFLLTAHHLNDSFETFLINAGRGTGPRGLVGIPASSNKIIRPLHSATRNAIVAYAKKNNIAWREDASNASVKYQRNALRHKVLPELLSSTKGYATGLENTLENMRSATLFAESKARLFFEQYAEINTHKWVLVSTERLQREIGVRYLLHFWLHPFGEFDFDAVETALKNPKGQYFESKTHELLITVSCIILKEKRWAWPEVRVQKMDTNALFGHHSFSFQYELNPAKAVLVESKKAFLDAEKLTFPLVLRTWKKGDRFTPYGMKGSKKISDFFTDLHLNKFEKEEIPLLLSGEDIVWVAGYRINEHYKITDPQKTAYFGRLLN